MIGNRLLVCGSRDWGAVLDAHGDKRSSRTTELLMMAAAMHEMVTDLYRQYGSVVVIDGGAKGADSMAYREAKTLGVDTVRYFADWNTHGKAAGFIRNQQMIDEGQPDVAMAFITKPLHLSRGTHDMVKRLAAAGIQTTIVESQPDS